MTGAEQLICRTPPLAASDHSHKKKVFPCDNEQMKRTPSQEVAVVIATLF